MSAFFLGPNFGGNDLNTTDLTRAFLESGSTAAAQDILGVSDLAQDIVSDMTNNISVAVSDRVRREQSVPSISTFITKNNVSARDADLLFAANDQTRAYVDGVTDDGRRFVEWDELLGNLGEPIGPAKLYDARQSSGLIYEVTIHVENVTGENGNAAIMAVTYDRDGNVQSSLPFHSQRQEAEEFGLEERTFTARFCTRPDDVARYPEADLVELAASDENTTSMHFLGGVRHKAGGGTVRLYSIDIRDVTAQFKGVNGIDIARARVVARGERNTIKVNDGGKSGTYSFHGGNQSTLVGIDIVGAYVIAPGWDQTGASGAYILDGEWQTSGVDPRRFGVVLGDLTRSYGPEMDMANRFAQATFAPFIWPGPVALGRQFTTNDSNDQHSAFMLLDNMLYLGRGRNLSRAILLDGADAHVFYAFNPSNITVRGIGIEANRDAQRQYIDGEPSSIIASYGTGIMLINDVTDVTIEQCGIKDTLHYGCGVEGVGMDKNFTFRGNDVENSGTDGIDMKQVLGSQNARILNNNIRGPRPAPQFLGQACINVRRNVKIKGNNCYDLVDTTRGVVVTGGGSLGQLGQTGYYARNVDVTGNMVTAQANDTDVIGIVNNGAHSRISGNLIDNCNSSIANRGAHSMITENISTNAERHIILARNNVAYTTPVTLSPDGTIVSGNVMDGDVGGQGIRVGANITGVVIGPNSFGTVSQEIIDDGIGTLYAQAA